MYVCTYMQYRREHVQFVSSYTPTNSLPLPHSPVQNKPLTNHDLQIPPPSPQHLLSQLHRPPFIRLPHRPQRSLQSLSPGLTTSFLSQARSSLDPIQPQDHEAHPVMLIPPGARLDSVSDAAGVFLQRWEDQDGDACVFVFGWHWWR